MEVKEG